MADERIVAQMVFEALNRTSSELQAIANDMVVMGDSAEEAGERSDEGFRVAGLSLTDLKSGLDLALGSLRQVAQAAEQMIEFAELGASAKQAELSFQGLAGQMGLSAGYMEQLREASRGTITDLDLMAGVGTLVAGTTDEFGGALAEAYPSLVEYAKAAAKLNPHLGDTAYMLESISTGIKRGSPLILDNLGLTIKIGEANEAYAAQLGKSVEALTAEEKQMALLNDAMRAGNRLVEQVGGSTEALTDEFEAFAASTENAKTEFALWWHELVAGSGALEVATTNLTAATDKMRFDRVIDEAKELGIVTEEEIARYGRLAAARGSQERKLEVMSELTAELTQRMQEHNVVVDESAVSEEVLARAREDDRRQTVDWTEAVAAATAAEEARTEVAEAASAAEEARAEAAQRAAEAQAAALEKVAEARRQAAAELGDEFTEALQAEEVATVDFVEALYAEADAAGASASTLALLAAATGDYTDAQIAAALRTAVLQEKIEEVAAAIVAGDISIGAAIENIKAFDEAMDELPDEKVVIDVEVAVAAVEADIEEAADEAARIFAEHVARDADVFSPQADTSAADAALETTSGKVGSLTEAVGAATGDAEGLKEAMEEIPTELELTITSNLPHQIQMLRQMESLIRNMPSVSVGGRDGYDDDPTSLH